MTRWIQIAVILLLAGAGSAKAAQGQQIERAHDARSDTFRTQRVELPWIDQEQASLLLHSRVAQPDSFPLQELQMTAGKRSWWRYPLIGAVAGGLTFAYITHRECQKEDCIFPVGLPLVGVALGAAGGFAVEGIVRVAKSR